MLIEPLIELLYRFLLFTELLYVDDIVMILDICKNEKCIVSYLFIICGNMSFGFRKVDVFLFFVIHI